jgi:hypothetical protein
LLCAQYNTSYSRQNEPIPTALTDFNSKMSDPTLHPRFMGLTGRPLSTAVSVVATTGFLLFGYDREWNRTLQPCFM